MKNIQLLIALMTSIFFSSCEKGDSGNNFTDGSSGGKGGSIARVAISNNHLYIVNSSEMKVYNVADPNNVKEVNKVAIGFDVETIYPYNDKLFIGAASAMYIYDISDPKNPGRQGMVSHIRACDPVVTDGSYAYVTLRNNSTGCGGTQNILNIYDISGGKILNPVLKGSTPLPQPYGLGIHENTLYVCCAEAGLAVVDVTNRTQPEVVKVVTEGKNYTDVIPFENTLFAYVKGGIALFDITDANDPQFIAEIKNTSN
ncbi:LVIVD repeat-containing protein [Niabella insulamsoli]|uniref:LVIVD repeat-containing protein n=1 Tax=Niabella insulamsoli TaxID=3144874 RepID=UPI0031FBF84F